MKLILSQQLRRIFCNGDGVACLHWFTHAYMHLKWITNLLCTEAKEVGSILGLTLSSFVDGDFVLFLLLHKLYGRLYLIFLMYMLHHLVIHLFFFYQRRLEQRDHIKGLEDALVLESV